ncbi:hypothetical protein PENTCL1PPCAC_13170, partial [Pristionchus entomophagus]
WKTGAKMQICSKKVGRDACNIDEVSHSCASWNRCKFWPIDGKVPTLYEAADRTSEIVVAIETESESFARLPIFDPNSSNHDVILVLEGKK